MAPARALGMALRNITVHREPLYALEEWAAPYDPALLRVSAEEVGLLNDDRVGRALDRLFDADRASMLTDLVLKAVREFEVDCSQLHNDSTSISLQGIYRRATGRPRGGKPTLRVVRGHSKDHRPDLKQLVWILTTSADGAVPIAYRAADGNTTDDVTHIPTWDGLVALLGRRDFLYVADSKLCTREAMDHIATGEGRFLAVMPRTRREDAQFRGWIRTHSPEWVEALRLPPRRLGLDQPVFRVCEGPVPSAEGYRIVWVWSSDKSRHDLHARGGRIERGIKALDELAAKVRGPRSRYGSRVAVDQAAAKCLQAAGAERWIAVEIAETVEESFRQQRRGRPGPDTAYRKTTRTRYGLTWKVLEDAVAADAASDGCFPLITNDRALTPTEVLTAYRYQPSLEQRHHLLKGILLADEMFLKSPARIEAVLFLHFVALLVHALLERELRTAMAASNRPDLPLYPEDRSCPAPTATRVFELFSDVSRNTLLRHGDIVQVFHPALTTVQCEVLKLLGIPTSAYTPAPT